MTMPEPGERLTPPQIGRDLLSTSVEAEQWCHVMQLPPEIRKREVRHMWASADPVLVSNRTTCMIQPEACFCFTHPEPNQWFPAASPNMLQPFVVTCE